MEYKTLQIAENFRENILYDSDSLALAVCSDHFDDYLHREWGVIGMTNLSLDLFCKAL